MKTRFLIFALSLGLIARCPALAQTPPRITRQPTNQCVTLGTTATVNLAATGTGPLSYQWRYQGTGVVGATNSSLTIPNLRYADAGLYDVVVANAFGAVTSQVAQLTVVSGFTLLTDGPIATDRGDPASVAWGDYDNDGRLDLFVANFGAAPTSNWLYHNLGNGHFERATDLAIAEGKGRFLAGAWGDFDNDGYPDLYVCNSMESSTNCNWFYRNQGDGSFSPVTTATLVQPGSFSEAVTWQDYDRDGFIDLLVVVSGPVPAQNRKNALLHNEDGESFSRVAQGLITGLALYEVNTAWADYDNDGWPDLAEIIGSDTPQLRVLRSRGGGDLITASGFPTQSRDWPSGGLAWGDYDNDGRLDLFAAGSAENHLLFHQETNGLFTRQVLVGPDAFWSVSSSWGDFDNDGYQDLFITRYNPRGDDVAGLLYHNQGDGTFTRVNGGALAEDAGFSFSCAWGDYDNDGFLDLALDRDHVHLYHNNGSGNHWLTLKLVGTVSNRSAIGAKVRLQATIKGKPMWQLREIAGGRGTSQDDPRPHFGLGDARVADLVRIEWPSGIVQELAQVPANQILTVTEPARLEMGSPGQLTIRCWKGQAFELKRSLDLVTWTSLGSATNVTGTLNITEPEAGSDAGRFYQVVSR